MKQEEYEGQIEELKQQVNQYENLLEALEYSGTPDFYQCCSCNDYMKTNDFGEYNDDSIGYDGTWILQQCNCCPVCAKEENWRTWSKEDEIPESDIEIGITMEIKRILEWGGKPCTKCMESHNKRVLQLAEDAIIKFAGFEGYTDDVCHALQYVSDEDLYSHPRYPNPWGPNKETSKSWCDKQDWFGHYIDAVNGFVDVAYFSE